MCEISPLIAFSAGVCCTIFFIVNALNICVWVVSQHHQLSAPTPLCFSKPMENYLNQRWALAISTVLIRLILFGLTNAVPYDTFKHIQHHLTLFPSVANVGSNISIQKCFSEK